MFSMIKTTLAAALVLASASLALAEGTDPNPQNRYPHLAAPGGPTTYNELRQRGGFALRSAPVRLHNRRNTAPAGSWNGYSGGQQNPIETDLNDRASSPYAPGGGG